jgi:hypothetical protein
MKFSTLAVLSLAVTSAAAISKNEALTVIQDEIEIAVHARHMVVQSTNHRQLQQNATACDAALVALLEDEALAAATDEYLAAYQSQADNLDVNVCNIGETSASCDFTNSAPSTTDLESACTALGGTIEGYDSNVACTMTVEGESVSFFLNAAPLYLCIPTVEGEDCKAEADATSAQVNELVDAELESALSLAGFAASCEVGTDVTSDMPGSGVAVARGLTALTGTAVAMAFVLL